MTASARATRIPATRIPATRARVTRARPAGRPLRPTLTVERRLWREGHGVVAGLDEVGRGAWAGPVSVGVVVLRPRMRSAAVPGWLRDSKALPEERRESGFDELAAWCAGWAVGHAEAVECDRYGMTAALRLAAYRALARLGTPVDALVIDGPLDLLVARPRPVQLGLPLSLSPDPALPGPPSGPLPLPDLVVPSTVVPVVGGDARCVSVAAASVLAKVVRDRHMRAEAEHFPPYLLERNKGYPSPAHRRALRGYGLSAIHRRSWSFAGDLPWR